VLRSVLRAWLPLSEVVLGMAVTHLPSPAAAAPERMPKLLALRQGAQPSAGLTPEAAAVLGSVASHLLASSSNSDAPLVVFVSKMISGELLPAAGAARAKCSAHRAALARRQWPGCCTPASALHWGAAGPRPTR
jgi:ribosome assembly protein 1